MTVWIVLEYNLFAGTCTSGGEERISSVFSSNDKAKERARVLNRKRGITASAEEWIVR